MTKTDNLRTKFDEMSIFPRHVCVLRNCAICMINYAVIMCVKGAACDYTKIEITNDAKIVVESCKQNHHLSCLSLRNPLVTKS